MGEPRKVSLAELERRLGPEGCEALTSLAREVTDRVGDTVLRWKVSWGVEDMITLIVMHTCIVTSRHLRLGELLEEDRSAHKPTG